MKNLAVIVFLAFFFLAAAGNVFAGKAINEACSPKVTNDCADLNLICEPDKANPNTGTCKAASINVKNPDKGFATLGNAISNFITIAFAVALLLVLVMLIWGAFE